MVYSTWGLMLAVTAAAVAIMVVRHALCCGDHGEFLITTLVILGAVFGLPIYFGGRVRAFSNGFIVAGVAYFVLTMAPGFQSGRWDFRHVPFTIAYCAVFDAVDPDPSFHPPRPGFDVLWEHPSLEERRNLFLRAAHSLTTLVLGTLGGCAAVILMRRCIERKKQLEDRADALIASDACDEPIRRSECLSDNSPGPT